MIERTPKRAQARMNDLRKLREMLKTEGRYYDAQVIDRAILSWQASIALNQKLSPDAVAYQQFLKKAAKEADK